MAGIGIITNPNSKLNKKKPTRGRLLGYIVGQFGNLEITNSVDDLGRVAQLFKDQGIEILAINGGDGTISRTLTAFIRVYGSQELPKVLVLRGGTINMLADNLGIRGSPEEILMRMLECQSGLRPKDVIPLATLSVGGQAGFLFGNGMIARYLEEFYKRKSGPIGAIILILKIYFYWIFAPASYRALIHEESYRIAFDGRDLPATSKSLAMMISTVERAPLGFRVFPEASSNRARFQYFSLEMAAGSLPWRILFAFLRNHSGTFLGKVSRTASTAVITSESGKQFYTLDGELFSAPSGRLAVGVGPIVQFVVV